MTLSTSFKPISASASRHQPLAQATKPKRIIYLDGIRGWASLFVLLSHLIVGFLAHSTPSLKFDKARLVADIAQHDYLDIALGIGVRFMSDGHLSVLIFFVLSGYALSISHLNTRKRNLALATTARYFRLAIPILITSLLIYLFLKLGLFFHLQAATTPERSSEWLGTFYQFEPSIKDVLSFSLYDVFFNYNAATSYNSSLWTMSVEIFGSLLIYTYLGIFRASHTVHWKIILLITTLLIIYAPLYACFCVGYILAEIQTQYGTQLAARSKSKYFQASGLIVFAATCVLSTYLRGHDRTTFFIATTLVTTVAVCPPLQAFFSNKLSEYLGKISFPLYLIQILVICSWSAYFFMHAPQIGLSPTVANYLNLLTTIVLCLVASTLLLPIENFSMKYSKKLGALFLNQTGDTR